jgi:hypothetical protein
MAHLTTVIGSFHARVIQARLASEGVDVALRGIDEGPYPLGFPVDVLVCEHDLPLAREILLADAVDAAFEPEGTVAVLATPRARRWSPLRWLRCRGARSAPRG